MSLNQENQTLNCKPSSSQQRKCTAKQNSTHSHYEIQIQQFQENNLNLQTPGANNGNIVNTSNHLLNQSQLARNLSENFNHLNLSIIKNQQNYQSKCNILKSQQINTGVGIMPVSSVKNISLMLSNKRSANQAQPTLNHSASQKFFCESPLFSQRLIRKWENMTGKVWYQLSPKFRMQVNIEISNLKHNSSSSNQIGHNTSQLNQGGNFNGLFNSTTSLATRNQKHQSAFMKIGGGK